MGVFKTTAIRQEIQITLLTPTQLLPDTTDADTQQMSQQRGQHSLIQFNRQLITMTPSLTYFTCTLHSVSTSLLKGITPIIVMLLSAIINCSLTLYIKSSSLHQIRDLFLIQLFYRKLWPNSYVYMCIKIYKWPYSGSASLLIQIHLSKHILVILEY